ncbi:MAG: glycosyltransferase [Candidatus Aminicenantes bacterium]|nr:glycosyltransferase [Candidatus Aminicenantes bacterium]
MEILFLGGLFPKEKEKEIFSKSRGPIQFAANNLQWNLIKGLDSNNGKPIKILNSPFISSFPKYYKDFYLRTYRWSHIDESDDWNVGFLNIFVIKQIWRALALALKIMKWATDQKEEKKTLLVYSIHTPFLFASWVAKKLNKRIHVCLIVPDLPEFMNLGEKKRFVYKILKFLDRLISTYLMTVIDSFVLLTYYMKERLYIKDKPWIVMEGIADIDNIGSKNNLNYQNEERAILYAGTLNNSYGILNLVKAFLKTEERTYRLWICGDGEARKDIEKIAEIDKRIIYYGQLCQERILKLQKEATILVNPRPSKMAYTKYSFPSKLIEYMASGTPVITTRLPGIPKEYYSYLFFFDDESIEGFKLTMEKILSLPEYELRAKGVAAREFILKEKNYLKQTERILEMIRACL